MCDKVIVNIWDEGKFVFINMNDRVVKGNKWSDSLSDSYSYRAESSVR
jgi:hypothetical protein